MGALLGLLAALAYGVSDFFGGLASRRTHFLWVGLGVQLVGAALSFTLAPLLTPADLSAGLIAHALLWGGLSGVGSALGTVALYRGYGRGEMAVVGPLSAVGAAALPSLVGAALGERLSVIALVGVVLALPAIWLLARQSATGPGSLRGGVADGIVSGLGFGLLFIALGQADPRTGLWPIAGGQASSAVLVAALVAVGAFRRPARPGFDRRTGGLVVATAVLSVTANIAYLYATRNGLITVSAVLTSLYPAFTVLLAVLVLRERPERGQLIGLVLAGGAVTLIVLG